MPTERRQNGAEIESDIVEVHAIEAHDRKRMFAIYEKYYEESSWERFLHDLGDKDTAIIIRRCDGLIVGFSTASFHVKEIEGRTIRYIFSGDTVVETTYWGNSTPLKEFFRMAGWRKSLYPRDPLYWFSIFKGHRTFRILPNFFRTFVPGNGSADHPELEQIRCAIATERYGSHFDAATGLIDFGRSLGHLRQEWAGLEGAAERSRFAASFLSQNPEARRGVELAAVAELDVANLKRYAAGMFAEGLSDAG